MEYIKELDSAFGTVTQKFREELQGVRSNRPSVKLVEDIKVEAYGQNLTVKEVGSLSVRPPRDIEINVWDKGLVNTVVKAIEAAKAGLSVGNNDNIIRVSLPPLTDERREEITKLVKKMSEEIRIQIRGNRDETMKKIKTAEEGGEITEDQEFKLKEQVQKAVDEANKKIEQLVEAKLKELSE